MQCCRATRHNIELMPGDVVTIFSQRDLRVPVARQTRLVSLEGEIASAGVYQLLPGETLQAADHARRRLHAARLRLWPRVRREETRARQQENLATAVRGSRRWLPCRRHAKPPTARDDPAGRSVVELVSSAATQAQLRACAHRGRTAASRSS